jgi:hypothetical protein
MDGVVAKDHDAWRTELIGALQKVVKPLGVHD